MFTIEGLEDMSFEILTDQKFKKKEQLLKLYWNFHPRFRFLKNIPFRAKLLDIGAGSGGMVFWREWGEPIRKDIEMFALDITEGEFFDKYMDYQICNLDVDSIKFNSSFFDNIIMSHVLEHLDDEARILNEVRSLIKQRGTLYIEIPTPETLSYPCRDKFINKGINCSTINFFDDKTHLKTFSLSALTEMVEDSGFAVVEKGFIVNKFLEEELFTHGVKNNDLETTTYGLWSKLKWAQYIICEKVGT